jgi:hypothetical protein
VRPVDDRQWQPELIAGDADCDCGGALGNLLENALTLRGPARRR